MVVAVGICVILNAIDGFDVLAIAFAAPVLAKEWALPAGELGVLFSSGLAGMTAATYVLGRLRTAPAAEARGFSP